MTVYHRTVDKTTRLDAYTAQPIYGVHWENCKAANVIQSGMRDADAVRIYIPFPHAPRLQIAPGDVVVRGICVRQIDATYTIAQLQRDHMSAVVTSVELRDYGSQDMQHYEVGGQ